MSQPDIKNEAGDAPQLNNKSDSEEKVNLLSFTNGVPIVTNRFLFNYLLSLKIKHFV